MGLGTEVKGIWLAKMEVAYRVAQTYPTAGSPYTIFTISGGPVWIVGLFARTVTAITLGATFRIAVAGVNICAATVVTSAINNVIVVPLEDTGLLPIIPNVAAATYPDPAAHTTGFTKVVSVPGNIVLTVTVANCDGSIDWFCMYYRMHEASMIA